MADIAGYVVGNLLRSLGLSHMLGFRALPTMAECVPVSLGSTMK